MKTAKPGTPEFREAIRQAFLSEHEIAASQGVYNFTEKDRYGLDDRSRIILTVKDGKYVPAKWAGWRTMSKSWVGRIVSWHSGARRLNRVYGSANR